MKLSNILILLSLAFLITACERDSPPPSTALQETAAQETTVPPAQPRGSEEEIRAVAELRPTQNNEAFGKIEFTQTSDGVRIVGEMEGLSPGKHGMHVHEFGDCSAPDATSAGGHFNPHGSSHGAPQSSPDQRHVGDFGNIEADADGKARFEMVDTVVQLTGSDTIVGKSVVVHSGEDDLTSQPSGDSGDRVACGIIQQVSQP